MLIGEFIKMQQTTKDTVRFYVAEGLLTPCKKGRNYWYDLKEEEDFQQIRELQDLGFSIATIKRIRHAHETKCGTTAQWKENQQLITKELQSIEEELANLQNRQLKLQKLAENLQELIKKHDNVTPFQR